MLRKITLLIYFFLLVLPVPAAFAEDIDRSTLELSEALEIGGLQDRLPQNAQPYMEGVSPSSAVDLNATINTFIDNGLGQAGGFIKMSLKSAVIIIAIVVLCGIISNMHEGVQNSKVPQFVLLAGILGIAAVTAGDVSGIIRQSSQAIQEMDAYSKVLLPTLAAAGAASGTPVTSVAHHLATLFFSGVIQTLIAKLLIPLAYAYMAALIANAALGQNQLMQVAKFIKWLTLALLTLMLTAYIAYITLSGTISSGVDALALRSAKFTLSGMVPVVGGIVSDAAEAVLSGAGVLRNSIGIYGLFVIIAVCVGPFLRMGIQYLMYKITAAVAAPMTDVRLVTLIDGLTGAFGMLLGMMAATSLIFFISIVATINGAGSL